MTGAIVFGVIYSILIHCGINILWKRITELTTPAKILTLVLLLVISFSIPHPALQIYQRLTAPPEELSVKSKEKKEDIKEQQKELIEKALPDETFKDITLATESFKPKTQKEEKIPQLTVLNNLPDNNIKKQLQKKYKEYYFQLGKSKLPEKLPQKKRKEILRKLRREAEIKAKKTVEKIMGKLEKEHKVNPTRVQLLDKIKKVSYMLSKYTSNWRIKDKNGKWNPTNTWEGLSSIEWARILLALAGTESGYKQYEVVYKNKNIKKGPKVVFRASCAAYGIMQINPTAVLRDLGRIIYDDLGIIGKTPETSYKYLRAKRRLTVIYLLLFKDKLEEIISSQQISFEKEILPFLQKLKRGSYIYKGKKRPIKDLSSFKDDLKKKWQVNLRIGAIWTYLILETIYHELGPPENGNYPLVQLLIASYNWSVDNILRKFKLYPYTWSFQTYQIWRHLYIFPEEYQKLFGINIKEKKDYWWDPNIVKKLRNSAHKERVNNKWGPARRFINWIIRRHKKKKLNTLMTKVFHTMTKIKGEKGKEKYKEFRKKIIEFLEINESEWNIFKKKTLEEIRKYIESKAEEQEKKKMEKKKKEKGEQEKVKGKEQKKGEKEKSQKPSPPAPLVPLTTKKNGGEGWIKIKRGGYVEIPMDLGKILKIKLGKNVILEVRYDMDSSQFIVQPIIIEKGEEKRKIPHPLPSTPLVVGRNPSILGSGGIQVIDHYVSRAHCRLSISKGKLKIEDLNSKNGTYYRIEKNELSKEEYVKEPWKYIENILGPQIRKLIKKNVKNLIEAKIVATNIRKYWNIFERALRKNIILVIARDPENPRLPTYLEYLIEAIDEIPEGLLSKTGIPLLLKIGKIESPYILGKADIRKTHGQAKLGITQFGSTSMFNPSTQQHIWNITLDKAKIRETVVHELIGHKLATLYDKNGQPIVPKKDWIAIMEANRIESIWVIKPDKEEEYLEAFENRDTINFSKFFDRYTIQTLQEVPEEDFLSLIRKEYTLPQNYTKNVHEIIAFSVENKDLDAENPDHNLDITRGILIRNLLREEYPIGIDEKGRKIYRSWSFDGQHWHPVYLRQEKDKWTKIEDPVDKVLDPFITASVICSELMKDQMEKVKKLVSGIEKEKLITEKEKEQIEALLRIICRYAGKEWKQTLKATVGVIDIALGKEINPEEFLNLVAILANSVWLLKYKAKYMFTFIEEVLSFLPDRLGRPKPNLIKQLVETFTPIFYNTDDPYYLKTEILDQILENMEEMEELQIFLNEVLPHTYLFGFMVGEFIWFIYSLEEELALSANKLLKSSLLSKIKNVLCIDWGSSEWEIFVEHWIINNIDDEKPEEWLEKELNPARLKNLFRQLFEEFQYDRVQLEEQTGLEPVEAYTLYNRIWEAKKKIQIGGIVLVSATSAYLIQKKPERKILQALINGGYVKMEGGQKYLIPLRNPTTVPYSHTHGRALFVRLGKGTFFFKGVGLPEPVIHPDVDNPQLVTSYEKGEGVYTFYGGLRESEAKYALTVEKQLRKTLNKKAPTDPGLQIVRSYGVRDDFLLNHIAIFKPEGFPAAVLSEEVANELQCTYLHKGLSLVKPEKLLAQIGFKNPEEIKGRILLYHTISPVRTEELGNILEDLDSWKEFFEYFGYFITLNEMGNLEVRDTEGSYPYSLAAERVLINAAVRYAAMIRLLLLNNGAGTNDGGSIFYSQNTNPISVFDYDTIWFLNKIEGAHKNTLIYYQLQDIREATDRIKEIAEKLNISPEEGLKVFYKIVFSPAEPVLKELYRGIVDIFNIYHLKIGELREGILQILEGSAQIEKNNNWDESKIKKLAALVDQLFPLMPSGKKVDIMSFILNLVSKARNTDGKLGSVSRQVEKLKKALSTAGIPPTLWDNLADALKKEGKICLGYIIHQLSYLLDIGEGRLLKLLSEEKVSADLNEILTKGKADYSTKQGRYVKILEIYNKVQQDIRALVPDKNFRGKTEVAVVFHIDQLLIQYPLGIKMVLKELGVGVKIGVRVLQDRMEEARKYIDSIWELRNKVIILPEDISSAQEKIVTEYKLDKSSIVFYLKNEEINEHIKEAIRQNHIKALTLNPQTPLYVALLFGVEIARLKDIYTGSRIRKDIKELLLSLLKKFGVEKQEAHRIISKMEKEGILPVRIKRLEDEFKDFGLHNLAAELSA